jgi:hypothetical protein
MPHLKLPLSRALTGDIVRSMMGTVLAYITFGGSMYGAVYLLLHDKPIQSLAALITALGAAFGPKTRAGARPFLGNPKIKKAGHALHELSALCFAVLPS